MVKRRNLFPNAHLFLPTDHAGCHYALGVLYTRQTQPKLAHTHFLKAAEHGDVQSQYNVGLHYLLQSPSTPAEHEKKWGVTPDDTLARRYFEQASLHHFAPALMNLAALLHEYRGNPPPGSAHHLSDEQQLRYSAALYAKVVSIGSTSSTPGAAQALVRFGLNKHSAQEMVALAQKEMAKVNARLAVYDAYEKP